MLSLKGKPALHSAGGLVYAEGVLEIVERWPMADQAIVVALVIAAIASPFLLLVISKQLADIIQLLRRR